MSAFFKSGGTGFEFTCMTVGVDDSCMMRISGSTGLKKCAAFGILLYTLIEITRAK